MLPVKPMTRALLLAVFFGVATGIVIALNHGPQPVGDGLLVFAGVLIGAVGVANPR